MLENQVIQEIISTENTFNESLTLLVAGFADDASVQHSKILMQFKPLISQLQAISESVLANIEKSAAEDIHQDALTLLRVQRTQLLKAFFQAYKAYTSIYGSFSNEIITNPAQFNALATHIETNSGTQLKLSDYLIQPLQRGPRYSLLVDAAIKNGAHLSGEQLQQLLLLATEIKECLKDANQFLAQKPQVQEYRIGDGSRYVYSALSQWWNKDKPIVEISAPIVQETDLAVDDDFVIISNPAVV